MRAVQDGVLKPRLRFPLCSFIDVPVIQILKEIKVRSDFTFFTCCLPFVEGNTTVVKVVPQRTFL